MSTLIVNERFVSIQGESSWCGYPCYFIRLAGCNLRCRYCDTPYAQDVRQGQPLTVTEIVAGVRDKRTPLVTVTGGEPLHQPGCRDLLEALLELPERIVTVETNGSYDITALPARAIAVMDIKTPGSGESASMDWANIERLRPHDEVKFVLCDRKDYVFALETIRSHDLSRRCRHILFAPAAGSLPAASLAQWMIVDQPPARLQLQIHRILDTP